jgi:spoIIIJ-associated protein
MIRIEADDLESAILKASKKLSCNYDEVDYFILQQPISGIFGVGKKSAIILASIKITKPHLKHIHSMEEAFEEGSEKKETIFQKISQKIHIPDRTETEEEIVKEIKEKIYNLIGFTCFEIDRIAISLLNSETLFILFDGKDAPLLIGREGYRYKSMLYVLQNWISKKYKLKVQLEIGEFIKKQNENVEKYLKDEVFTEIDTKGFFKTKILDDILVKLAVKKLRSRYADKYVKVRNTQDGSKFIVIDEFFTKKI